MEIHTIVILRLVPDLIREAKRRRIYSADFSRFERFYPKLPKDSLKVAESGFKSTKRIKIVEQLGYDAILMGTTLMKSKNPGKKLERIIKEL